MQNAELGVRNAEFNAELMVLGSFVFLVNKNSVTVIP